MNTGTSASAIVDFLKPKVAETNVPEDEGGFLQSQLFTLILSGNAKLPLDRVEDVAKLLGCDKRQLFRLALLQFYTEDAVRLLENMLANPITDAEKMWLNEIRSAAAGAVQEPNCIARRFVRVLSRTRASVDDL
ncbi:hypothetical protein [Sinorhizobium fredii]|uniref:hypothetical protein n=1 Tax=Rhizobium fredii TaxID=380 RepID=UPI0004B8C28C|nr:hypothetical protein [Sinorhizobium fredii]